MAYTGYTKTEQNVGAKWNGWLWVKTYINQAPCRTMRRLSTGSMQYIWNWPNVQNIYCHQNAAPEPATDGHILTSVFDDAETEYSGPAGYIKSFTSSSGFFTFNQNLAIQPEWTIYFTAKSTGGTSGYTSYCRIEFYKRDSASSTDTLLFQSEYNPVPGIYPAAGLTMPAYPAGTVTTLDRLRIRVYMREALPA